MNGVRVRVGGTEYFNVFGLKRSFVFEVSNVLTHLKAKVDWYSRVEDNALMPTVVVVLADFFCAQTIYKVWK